MEIKHNDIEISETDPFANCKLGRRSYAKVLTSIVDSFTDGFVLAINNEWGTGKTTFVKMWEQSLKNSGHKTLYFNAWENDFESNPLVAIMSELKSLNPNKNDETYKSLLKKGSLITKSILPLVAKAIASKYIDSDILLDGIEKITESAADILEEEIDEYAAKKKGLIEFRSELKKYVENNNNSQPLIFIVDELDRCNPKYSVEVLEQIKHFFNVPGIVFVLSIDKKQLGNAVRGFYGSDLINADEYLRRFIDLEYILPSPSENLFSEYLYNYFKFDAFFGATQRMSHYETSSDKDSFLIMASHLFRKNNINLRQQEKLFSYSRVVLNTFNPDQYVFPAVYLILIYIRFFAFDLYKSIRERNISLQELTIRVEELFPDEMDRLDSNFYTTTQARLVLFYFNFYKERYRNSQLISFRGTEREEVLVKSNTNNENLSNTIISLYNTRTSDMKLDYLLDRIDLVKELVKI